MLGSGFRLLGMQQAGINEDIPEPYDTLEENALAKARHVYQKTGKSCFADDTGLETEALGGAPGVHSARFAGESRSSTANMKKLLKLLENSENRQARFRTIIALILKGQEYLFEGIVQGEITRTAAGTTGFGYDPIFKPTGYQTTFAQMSLEEKNKISHRKNAVRKLVEFLRGDSPGL